MTLTATFICEVLLTMVQIGGCSSSEPRLTTMMDDGHTIFFWSSVTDEGDDVSAGLLLLLDTV